MVISLVIILTALLTCAAAAAVYYFRMVNGGTPTTNLSAPPNYFINAPAPSGSVSWPAQGTVLAQTDRASDSYLDETVWVGDSRIVGMALNNMIKESNAFAETGLSHDNINAVSCVEINGRNYTIPQAVGIRKPKRMVIAFGINGIAWMSIDDFMESYTQMVETLQRRSPDSVIILQAILPVSSTYERNEPRVTNRKIDQYNQRIKQLAEEMGLYYLEADTALKNTDGSLYSAYNNGDGLHYNKAGAQAIVDYFMTHQAP